MKTRATGPLLLLCCCSLLLAAGSLSVTIAQDEEKGIRAEEFIGTRPVMNPPRRNTPSSTGRYKTTIKTHAGTTAATPPPGMSFAQVGVTTWRFRKSTAQDKTKELIEVDVEQGPAEYTLARVPDGTPLAIGQIVRLSIESLSRDGYMYVIDREQYADGSRSEPLLIFPTRKAPDANRVRAGRLVSIPSALGKGFQIKPKPSDKKQVAEVLTILISANPLVDLAKLGAKPYLSSQQVADWEKKWGAVPTRFELDGGSGQAMTEQEQAAAANSTMELTRDDPGPQTVYRVAIKPENPVMVSVPLKLKTN